jgi:hypothetical protein
MHADHDARTYSGSWTEDEVTIDWTRLSDPRRSSTTRNELRSIL